jgi:hypothetical protein
MILNAIPSFFTTDNLGEPFLEGSLSMKPKQGEIYTMEEAFSS